MSGIEIINQRVREESIFLDSIKQEVSKVIVGQSELIDRLIIGLLTNGHILLEGVPGLAKTLTIQTSPNTVDFKGFLIRQDVADHTASTNADVDAAASGDDKIVFGAAAGVGSYVEVYCDGTNWYANGISHLGTLRFAAT